jgi:tripartite-type tricarboxylate transporter receptor subunit TctC
MRPRLVRCIVGLVAALFVVAPHHGGVQAQTYPTRPIKLIAPFAAGGPTDVTARMLAEALGFRLGQPIVVENVGGAGGNVGAARAAPAGPHGYTLGFPNLPMAVSPPSSLELA